MAAIKVGIPISRSGQFQTQGRQALAGLHAWAEDANRAGGVEIGGQRREIKVIHHDDASLAESAISVTERLIKTDQVGLLFGPYSSGLARAAVAVAAEYGQVLWNQGGAAEEIYQPGRRVVGILSGAEEYMAALPGLVKRADPSASSFAVLRCSAGAFAEHVADGLEARAFALGFTQILHREFPPEQSDFSDLAEEVICANPYLLLVVGRIRHDLAIARALTCRWRKGGRPKATAVVAAPINQFREELGCDAEGFIGPSQWEPPASEKPGKQPDSYFGPTAAQVMASLRRASLAAGGLPVDYPMAQAYAAGLVAQRCLQEAGTLEPDPLWEAAAGLDFHTFFGRFRIDPNTGRQMGRSVYLVQWQQGRKVVIWPPEQEGGSLLLY